MLVNSKSQINKNTFTTLLFGYNIIVTVRRDTATQNARLAGAATPTQYPDCVLRRQTCY